MRTVLVTASRQWTTSTLPLRQAFTAAGLRLILIIAVLPLHSAMLTRKLRKFRYSRIARSVSVVPVAGRTGSLIGQTLEAGLCSRARRQEIGYSVRATFGSAWA